MSEKSKFEQGYELYQKLRHGNQRKVIIRRMVDELGMNKATASTYYYQYTKLKDAPNKGQKEPQKKNNWLQVNNNTKASSDTPEIEDVEIYPEQRMIGEVYVIRPIFSNADRNDQEYVLSGEYKTHALAERVAKGMRNGKLFDKPYLKYDNGGNKFVVWNCKVPAHSKDITTKLRQLGV